MRKIHFTDAARRFEPVDLGHLCIHENNIVGNITNRLDRGGSAVADVRFEAKFFEEFQTDFLIYNIIVG